MITIQVPAASFLSAGGAEKASSGDLNRYIFCCPLSYAPVMEIFTYTEVI